MSRVPLNISIYHGLDCRQHVVIIICYFVRKIVLLLIFDYADQEGKRTAPLEKIPSQQLEVIEEKNPHLGKKMLGTELDVICCLEFSVPIKQEKAF